MIGTSKMSDVRATLGNPYREIDLAEISKKWMHFGDEKDATLWIYLYSTHTILFGGGAKGLNVKFDGHGVLSDYSFGSSFKEDKTNEPLKKKWKDFDIFLAKEKIRPKKTTQEEVLALLGKVHQEFLINKPGAMKRWVYHFQELSKDEKVLVPVNSVFGSTNVEVNVLYKKNLFVDFDGKGIVVYLRGSSDFPKDKDRFFTK